jgi:aerobic carbon-monoxide dehydrogenase medium subunit
VKPPPFRYSRPESVAEALALLENAADSGAKVLAGGQSLVPLLSMRLATPAHLVDINRLTELSYVEVAGGTLAAGTGAGGTLAGGTGEGGTVAGGTGGGGTVADATVRVGALARHADVLGSLAAAAAQPLLRTALRFVAHPAIRNRGTTVGSLVHADPAGEMPAVLALLGGTVRVASTAGERTIPASEFFLGPLESAVQPDELAVEARFPVLRAGTGTGFAEISRRRGDYAVCGVAVLAWLGGDGRVGGATAAYLSVGPVPVVLDLTDAVAGAEPDSCLSAAASLASGRLQPSADIHATASYRRHLAGVLTERALLDALAGARETIDA